MAIKDNIKKLRTAATWPRFSGFEATEILMLSLASIKCFVRVGFGSTQGKQPGQYTPPELAAMSSRLYVLVDRIGVSCLTVRLDIFSNHRV